MADPIYSLAYDSRKPKDIKDDPNGKPIWKNCGVVFENDNLMREVERIVRESKENAGPDVVTDPFKLDNR